jgi:putative DNA primase/helicase
MNSTPRHTLSPSAIPPNDFSLHRPHRSRGADGGGEAPPWLAKADRGALPQSGLTWADVARMTHGQLGRTVRTPCPWCSHTRRTINQRKPVLAVKLKEPDFAMYYCAHCGESGYVHPERSSQVIDLAQRKRLRAEADKREQDDRQRRTAFALQLWNERQPFRGSAAETYLRDTRRIGDWLEAFDLDESLGFHPACTFGDERLPCMVALVRNIQTDEPQAIHRTALKLGPRPERIDRLSLGPTANGAIKLSLDGDVTQGLLIGEGIETVLSASLMLKFRPCWSVLSRSGIAKFPILSGIECITIAVDNDDSGDGQRDAATLAERLVAAGVEAVTAHSALGKDFNDALRGSK